MKETKESRDATAKFEQLCLECSCEVTAAAGVKGNSDVFDGASLLKIKDSEQFTGEEAGFTLTAWVNPYLLGGERQMIAAKDRYSLGERQSGRRICG